MTEKPPTVFFAIPCGDFYAVQSKLIRQVTEAAGLKADIIEDDPSTEGLWDKITQRINDADYFVADITSQSPNIVVELGYAIAMKPINQIAVLCADYVRIPSDLAGLIIQKYSSLNSFQKKLMDWLDTSIPSINRACFKSIKPEQFVFEEDFLDQYAFLRHWNPPPNCSYLLTPEGLKFSWAHFPILSTPLAILKNCEFEFDALINKENVGWVVKGTTSPNSFIPTFLIMFNINTRGDLVPHIWTEKNPVMNTHYHVYQDKVVNVDLAKSKDGWFTILTRIQGDIIEICNEGTTLFRADFSSEPYAEAYNSIPRKMGQIGFRCHPNEEATVRRVRVREI